MIAVADLAVCSDAIQRIAIAQDLGDEIAAMRDAPDPGTDQHQQQHRIDEDARSQQTCGFAIQPVLGGVAHQALRIAELFHDAIASVHAGATGDALVLQTVAYVYASRTDLHAQRAIDAVPELQWC